MAGVKQARDGAVGILTLDKPARLNAMTPDLLGALAAAVAHELGGTIPPRNRASGNHSQ